MVSRNGAIGLPIVSKFDSRGVDDAKNAFGALGRFANKMGPVIAGAFAIGAVGVGAFATEAIKAANESDKISRGLENAIKNAGVFGNTNADIKKATGALEEHAKKLGELIGVDDEVITSMERTWMAVPELAALGIPGIKNLAKVTADVAAGTGKDIESIGGAFIKVAGDERSAMGKLMRMNIVFTDEQKKTYQAFLDSNDEIGAQSYLIDQLGKTYKGAAEQMATPLDRIKVIFDNILEVIGNAFGPALKNLADYFQNVRDKMETSEEYKTFIKNLGDYMTDTVNAFIGFSDWYFKNQDLANTIAGAFGIVTAAMAAATGAVWAFNIALYANPIGLVAAAIIATIGFIVGTIWMLAANWDTVVLAMKNLWDYFSYAIAIAWTGTVQLIITGINYVLDGFNKLLSIWNTLTGTDFHVDLLAQVRDPSPPANWYGTVVGGYRPGGMKLATGGIVMPRPGGTMATIGEAGQAEAVIPLDKLGTIMGGTGGGTTYNVVVNGGLSTSADIGRAVVDAIKKYERVSGPVFVGA
jgi:hypothetical protein